MFNFLKKKQSKHIIKKYVLFNVDIFNKWFCDKQNDAVYAHEGIFLRLDKLGKVHIADYLLKCHNFELSDNEDISNEINNFYEEIRKDWLKKLDNE